MPLILVPSSDKHTGVKISVLDANGNESESWTLDNSIKSLHILDHVWDAAHKIVSQFTGRNGTVDPQAPQEVLKEKAASVEVPVSTPIGKEPASGPAPSADPVGTGADACKGDEPSRQVRQARQPKAKPVGQPPADVAQSPVVVADAVTAEVTPAATDAPQAEEKATE